MAISFHFKQKKTRDKMEENENIFHAIFHKMLNEVEVTQ